MGLALGRAVSPLLWGPAVQTHFTPLLSLGGRTTAFTRATCKDTLTQQRASAPAVGSGRTSDCPGAAWLARGQHRAWPQCTQWRCSWQTRCRVTVSWCDQALASRPCADGGIAQLSPEEERTTSLFLLAVGVLTSLAQRLAGKAYCSGGGRPMAQDETGNRGTAGGVGRSALPGQRGTACPGSVLSSPGRLDQTLPECCSW